jgi:5-methylcytosine-specific restriction endonuclease McrA
MKTCTCCKEIKYKSEFYNKKSRNDGLDTQCKTCIDIKSKNYNAKNKLKVAAMNRKWQLENPDKCRNATDKYRMANPEKWKANANKRILENFEQIKTQKKEYRTVNLKKVTAQQQAWRKSNPEKYKTSRVVWVKLNKDKLLVQAVQGQHKRRALKKKSGGTYTHIDIENLLITQDSKCVYCKIELITIGKGKYHVDHRMPLKLGGSNYPENLQLLCPKCNLSKSAKHPKEYESSIGITHNDDTT